MSCGLGGPTGRPMSEHLGVGYTGMVPVSALPPSGQFYDHDTSWRPPAYVRPVEEPVHFVRQEPVAPPVVLPEWKPVRIPSPEPLYLRPDLDKVIGKRGRYSDDF